MTSLARGQFYILSINTQEGAEGRRSRGAEGQRGRGAEGRRHKNVIF